MPSEARSRPFTGTYRLQLHAGFTFADAAGVCDYLAALGVSHVYCSPVLAARPGSTHGYDVVDHSRLSDELGGADGFDEMVAAAHRAGLGLVVDVVPNHMAVPTPESLNGPLFAVLHEGRSSPHAGWFDVDWAAQDDRLLMPVLGAPLGEVLEAGELVVDRAAQPEPVLRYHDHVFPLADGTADLPMPDLLGAQHYRLCFWRVGTEELNYRRFFDITDLVGVRVEDDAVFEATHRVLLDRVRNGDVDGLRIDHPDGLADPRGYLQALARATDGAWVVVEKILEGTESLPGDWPCAGTTGYEALRAFGGVLADPAGEQPLTDLYTSLTGADADFADIVEASKRHVVTHVLGAEVERLTTLGVRICAADVRLADHSRRALRSALEEMLVAFDVYRAYVVPGEQPGAAAVATVDRAAAQAVARRPDLAAEIDLVHALALGRLDGNDSKDLRAEFVVRFAQTCGPVMAKGVEDTAFYRYTRFVAANEVGGDPGTFGVTVEAVHEANAVRQRDWPRAMTTLSTHDTKRSEDVRASLAVLSELPREWSGAVTTWRAKAAQHRPHELGADPSTEYLFWQTLVGAWPVDAVRMGSYMEKATREAKRHTSWTEPNPAYDAAVRTFVEAVLGDDALTAEVAAFVERIRPYAACNVLAQKLLGLTAPGVPDMYQGMDCVELSLVDPDNRRPVDYQRRRRLLDDLDALEPGTLPDPSTDLDAAKLLVTSRALRLRRAQPDWFDENGGYEPLEAAGAAAAHVLAFSRAGRAVTVTGRLTAVLERHGGWQDTTVSLRAGEWRDLLSGAACSGGTVPASELLGRFPVALLVRA